MESKKLVLLGGGGHCKSVLDALIRSYEYEDIVITDPDIEAGTTILGYKVIGTDDMLPELYSRGFQYAFITVGDLGNSRIRKKLSELTFNIGFTFPVITDPSAGISQTASIGGGTFVGKNAVINAECNVGRHCIINTGAIIEHECEVGDFTHVSVGAIICGNCKIGEESFIGAGSTVIQGIKIGDNAIVGANSTVLSSIENYMKVYGIVKKIRESFR